LTTKENKTPKNPKASNHTMTPKAEKEFPLPLEGKTVMVKRRLTLSEKPAFIVKAIIN
jgi:hypothetical protein